MKDKPFIYYHKLSTIFGKDRATGTRAEDLGEEEVVSETEETTPNNVEDKDVDIGVNPSPEIVEGKGTKCKRGKTYEFIHIYSSSSDMLNNTINAIGNEMNLNLSKMANDQERKLQCEIDLMKRVQKEIDALPGITFEEAFEATDVIGKCPFKAELLFGYDQGKKINMISPYDITTLDNPGLVITQVQLKGDNYDEWSRSFRMAIRARKMFGFIDGTIERTGEKDKDIEDWWTISSLLVSWIRNTIEPSLRYTISHVEIAKDMWDDIKDRFSITNGHRIQQLKSNLAGC
ncbi:retrovirus-related pol polyprotein from transposon TNT 1-94 [Tanacetum coccineum]